MTDESIDGAVDPRRYKWGRPPDALGGLFHATKSRVGGALAAVGRFHGHQARQKIAQGA